MDNPNETYRPLSQLAVASLVVGVLSWCAFFSIFLWFVPVIGLVLAVGTVRILRSAAGEYAGLPLARIGLALCAIVAVAAPTQAGVQWLLLTRSAHAFVNEYLDDVLANHLDEAAIAHLAPHDRLTGSKADQLERVDFRMFNEDMLVHRLVGRGAEAQVAYTGVSQYEYVAGHGSVAGNWLIGLTYRITLPSDTITVEITVLGRRSLQGEWSGWQWTVSGSTVH